MRFMGWFIAALDTVVVFAAYVLALHLRFAGAASGLPVEYLGLCAAIAFVHAAALAVYETNHSLHRPFIDTITSIVIAVLVSTFVSLSLPFAAGLRIPRSVFLIGPPLALLAVTACRVPFIVFSKRYRARRRALIVSGSRALAEKVASLLRASFGSVELALAGELKGRVDELSGLRVDDVVMCPDVPPDIRQEIQLWAVTHGKQFQVIPSLYEVLMRRAGMARVGDFPVFEMRRPALPADYQVVKRLLDIVGSILGLFLAAPVMLLIALAIKVTSPGPVIFRQARVGLGGRVFTLYKFRTMRPDAERDTGPVLATQNDARITPVGRLLRATRLDELPQVYNVLRGDMSLVGPRPERPEFVTVFEKQIPYYSLRHSVRPGIAGLAQVLADYSTDVRDKIRYDLMYIAEYSPVLDFKILAMTVRTVLWPSVAPGLRWISSLEERWTTLNGGARR